MIKWLSILPKTILVILILGTGIIFIVLSDPPHTICRTQVENFKEVQTGMIYRDTKVKTRTKPIIPLLVQECKKYNTPGSCYGLFAKIRKFIYNFNVVSHDCESQLSNIPMVQKTMFELYSLMVHLSWGDMAPKSEYHDKLNWFSDVDTALFCLIRDKILILYGKEQLHTFEKKMFKKLPGIKKLSETQIRDLSLVSVNCSLYPAL